MRIFLSGVLTGLVAVLGGCSTGREEAEPVTPLQLCSKGDYHGAMRALPAVMEEWATYTARTSSTCEGAAGLEYATTMAAIAGKGDAAWGKILDDPQIPYEYKTGMIFEILEGRLGKGAAYMGNKSHFIVPTSGPVDLDHEMIKLPLTPAVRAEFPLSYRWEVTAHDLDYKQHKDVLNEAYSLIFDATVLKIARTHPKKTGDRKSAVYDEIVLTLEIHGIWHKDMTRHIGGADLHPPCTIHVRVEDVVSSFPSGPSPYFRTGGLYRFFCDAPTVDKVIRVGVGNLGIEKWREAKVRRLIKDLDAADPDVRGKAARALGRLRPRAKDAIPALIKALGDAEAVVRVDAAKALGSIGPDARDAVPALIKAVDDASPNVRGSAAQTLGKMGPEPRERVPVLVNALGDTDHDVRYCAAQALGWIGPTAKDAVPALADALNDANANVRWQAAVTLGKIGPEAKEAIPDLERLAQKDAQSWVREAAQEVLKKIQPR